MTDTIDEVQRWNELHLEVSLKNQSLKNQPEEPEGFDGFHCFDCGDLIEPERLTLKRCRCAECAHHKERIEQARRRGGRSE